MLGQESMRRLYLKMPDPKRVVIWRTTAADVVSAMQVVPYAEKRPRSRSGKPSSSKPSSSQSVVVHLWSEPLDGWVPEEYDTLVIVEDGLTVAWVVGSVAEELQGVRYRLTCSKSSTDDALRTQIQSALAMV